MVINAVPLFEGYRWHWVARLWRRRGIGELVNLDGEPPGPGARCCARPAATGARCRDEFVDGIWRHRQRGTARPTLELYRSADPDRLAAAGARLGELGGPALVVWGTSRPLPRPRCSARGFEKRLPGAALVEVPDGGHWPWIDRPDVVGTVVGFVEAG